MKNQYNLKWSLIFIICITIIPLKSVNAQFGNYFCFPQTDFDERFMVRGPSSSIEPDTSLKYVLLRFDPTFNFNHFEYMQAVFTRVPVKKIRVTDKSFVKDKIDFKKALPRSPLILGVKLNPTLEHYYAQDVISISKSFPRYNINDSSEAILIAMGITTQNAPEFRYHVVENDSTEIIPWSPIPRLEQNYGAIIPYAFLGKYKSPGKQILIEVVSSKDYSLRDGVVFDWRVNHKPIVTQIVVYNPSGYFNLNNRKLNHNYATAFDSVSGLPLNLKFPVGSIDQLKLDFESHLTMPYAVSLKRTINGKTEIEGIDDYSGIENYFYLSKEKFAAPGQYELLIESADYGREKNMLRIPFEVLEPKLEEKTFSARQIILYGVALLFLIAIAFLMYYLRNKQKLAMSIRSKEKTELQLKSIRSQLNPHFMFNALSSIQNLMDRNETSAANHYLSIFSRLTREVLNSGEKELISLEDEINLIDNYLKMEQLRFGFQYTLTIENGLNKANIEIPAMLLQPMVENAVKHGISGLRDKGIINVSISSTHHILLLSISDNGKGFDKNKASNYISGLGIKLTNERISLLNKIYPDQPISIEFNLSEQGTKVDIKLKDWL
jgi:two-component system LytT family sensor kinase